MSDDFPLLASPSTPCSKVVEQRLWKLRGGSMPGSVELEEIGSVKSSKEGPTGPG